MGPPGASTTRWLAVFPFAEENGVRPTLSAGNFPPGAETLLEAPTIAKDFHGFISTTFRDYKYISVMAEAQCLLEGPPCLMAAVFRCCGLVPREYMGQKAGRQYPLPMRDSCHR